MRYARKAEAESKAQFHALPARAKATDDADVSAPELAGLAHHISAAQTPSLTVSQA